jgi:hypothetical protein
VLEDQLLLVIGLQDQRILIETLDSPRKLYAAHEINREENFVLTGVIQKAILYVLRRFFHSGSKALAGK